MLPVERLLQISILLLVSLSSLLLGIGQRDLQITLLGTGGAVAALLITDVWRIFALNRWMANAAALAVTGLALHNFLAHDAGYQLVAVANLLVYLQTVLLFQEKTPKVYWQVMVLSLLQVVVAAAFTLGFEGGVLFLLYLLLAGGTLLLVNIHSQNFEMTERRDLWRRAAEAQSSSVTPSAANNLAASGLPSLVVAFDQPCHQRRVLPRMMRHIFSMALASLLFAMVLFYLLPRDRNIWLGHLVGQAGYTGFSLNVDLDVRHKIWLSNRAVMDVRYRDPQTEQLVPIRGEPYLRGMALSKLEVKDGKTTWTAPYDRVYLDSYSGDLEPVYEYPFLRNFVIQEILLEPTNDPMLFSPQPAYRVPYAISEEDSERADEMDYSEALAALTRARYSDRMELSTYRYRLVVPLRDDGRLFEAFPYRNAFIAHRHQSMERSPAEFEYLTLIDRDRYPTLVKVAQQVIDESGTAGDFRMMAHALEEHFHNSDLYTYTIDFTTVPRDESLDPIEDFMRNHRSGHCELYASALTLMLRSQGIPARFVVGFRGGELNPNTYTWRVEERFAHAWVEAYLRPEDCTPDMIERGEASTGGAWLTLEPTPGSIDDVERNLMSTANDVFGRARNMWRDYILGLNSDRQQSALYDTLNEQPLGAFAALFNPMMWQNMAAGVLTQLGLSATPWTITGLAAAVLSVLGVVVVVTVRRMSARWAQQGSPPQRLRQVLQRALLLFSPRLARWVAGEDDVPAASVGFYQAMVRVLQRHGLLRRHNQTQREFAEIAEQHFADHPAFTQIHQLIDRVTEEFYRVRFGRGPLTRDQRRELEQAVEQLESTLRGADRHPAVAN